ncbi:hypothetical protein V5799_006282 [Amblyomma americanum]|uniref:Uncharacterized protein n=1 Tax=Amblyomma americanum TaxID=6943 RepID=A0AAQ4DWU9_AMBAM
MGSVRMEKGRWWFSEHGTVLLQGHVPSRKVPQRWIFPAELPPPPSGRSGLEVGAGRLRATSPAVRFHGGGGFRTVGADRSGLFPQVMRPLPNECAGV